MYILRLSKSRLRIILLSMSMVGASHAVPGGCEAGCGGGQEAGHGRLPGQAEQQAGARLVLVGEGRRGG